MFLDTTSKSVRIFLSGAITTNQAVVNSDWGDNTTTTYTAGSADFLTNGVTPVTIVASPAASTQRIVQRINVYNADTAPITVTVQTVNGANNRTEITATLQVAERLEFVKEQGWSTYNAQGSQKVIAVTSTVEPGYIDGMIMTRVSGTSLTVSSGTFYIPGIGFNVNFPSAINKPGLVLTASTFYHVYAFLNAGVPDIEIVTTAPSAAYNGTARTKTGDTTRRYIGSVYSDAGSNIANFMHNNATIRYIDYTQTPPFRVLSSGTATVSTTVSAAGIVPVTAQALIANVLNTDATVFGQVNFVGAGAQQFFGRTSNIIALAWFAINSSQQFAYNLTGASTGGAMFIDVLGYTYER